MLNTLTRTTLAYFLCLMIGPSLLSAGEIEILHRGPWTKKSYGIKGSWQIANESNKTYVILSKDFKTKKAPDLRLFLSRRPPDMLNNVNAFHGSVHVSLLTSHKGAQRYAITNNVDLAKFRSVLIHCEKYSKLWGDGKHTLEQLILRDDRAVCMAPLFLTRHAAQLYDIPAPGKEIPLVEVGTHCLGAEFRDGEWVRTPALESVVDRISKTYDGFFFGRYDVRTPCIDDFRNGKNFKIVELNGVTSEATNIYDPANSVLKAYRILMKQWYYAFEIGACNRDRGVQPTPTRKLLAILEASTVGAHGKS